VIYEPVLMSEEELIGLWGNETGVLEFLENGEVSFIFYYGQQEQILNYEITKEGAFVTDGEKIIKIIEYGGNQITLVEINDELDCNPEFQVLKRIEEAVIPNKKEPTIELDGNFIKVTLNDKYYEQTCFNYSKLFFKKDGGWQRVTKPNSKGQYFLDDQFIGYGMCDVVMCVEARDISVPLKRYEYFGDINACPGSFTNQMCGRYPSYGLVDINGPVKIELDFYLGSDCKIPKHFEKEFERDFVSDEKGIPLCKNMGSKSEGWYDSVSGEFIEWDSCKNCQATCAELQVQPGTIVDKMNTWFNSCNINEIDFNNSCPMCVLEGEEYISLNTLDGPKCCPGLDTITGNTPSNDFCSQCGNHNCEPWENALSCGIDCDEVGG